MPVAGLNLFQFHLPGLLRQKQPCAQFTLTVALVFCFALLVGIFSCSTIIRKENSLPVLVVSGKMFKIYFIIQRISIV